MKLSHISVFCISGMAALAIGVSTPTAYADESEQIDRSELTEKEAEKLDSLLKDRTATGTRTCISQTQIRNMVAVNDNILVYRMRGGDVYVNQPPNGCPNADRVTLITNKPTTRLCRGDIAQLTDFRAGGITLGACSFGQFIHYEKLDQASD